MFHGDPNKDQASGQGSEALESSWGRGCEGRGSWSHPQGPGPAVLGTTQCVGEREMHSEPAPQGQGGCFRETAHRGVCVCLCVCMCVCVCARACVSKPLRLSLWSPGDAAEGPLRRPSRQHSTRARHPPQSRHTSHVCPLTAWAKAGGGVAAAGILGSLLVAEALKPRDRGAVGVMASGRWDLLPLLQDR